MGSPNAGTVARKKEKRNFAGEPCSCGSACLIWSWREAKKRHRAMASFGVWARQRTIIDGTTIDHAMTAALRRRALAQTS